MYIFSCFFFFFFFFFFFNFLFFFFFFQAEDGIRDRSPSRGLGDVYKRQVPTPTGVAGNGGVRSSEESPRAPVPSGSHRQGEDRTGELREPPLTPRYPCPCWWVA